MKLVLEWNCSFQFKSYTQCFYKNFQSTSISKIKPVYHYSRVQWRLECKHDDYDEKKKSKQMLHACAVTLIIVFISNIYQILRSITETYVKTNQHVATNYCIINSLINTLTRPFWRIVFWTLEDTMQRPADKIAFLFY